MGNKPWWVPDTKGFIAIFIVGAFVTAVFIWMVFPPKDVDQAALTVINMLLGALVAKFGTVVDFNFGSSQGSKDKDDAQNQVIKNITTAGTGNGAAIVAAAEAAAPPAAAVAAPPAVDAELDRRGVPEPPSPRRA